MKRRKGSILREVAEETGLQACASPRLLGVWDFQKKNQLIVAYHVPAAGEIVLSPELAEYKLIPPTGALLAAGHPGNLSAAARHPNPSFRDEPAIDRELDVRGLNCPLPILKAKKALAELESGGKYCASWPPTRARPMTSRAFARQTGHELLEQRQQQDEFVHVLKKK
ncbi:MAG: sulfurtransferase TusA family protein [Inhella sp.]